MNEMIYSCERKYPLDPLNLVFTIIFCLIYYIVGYVIFGVCLQIDGYYSVPVFLIGLVLFGLFITFIIRRQNKKVDIALRRKEGIMLNGIKVQGVAKKRASALYVVYIDPSDGQQKGFVTPDIYGKPERNVEWLCDVYITESELYATNFSIKN